jgi:predicted nucleic-acid-binding protein
MRAIDTNVLVRLIARDEAAQVASAEYFVKGSAWVSVLTLAEAMWVLRSVYKLGSEELTSVIQMLLDHDKFVLEDSDVVRTALELLRARPSLGFSDCLILEMARKAGHMPLGTFDRNLARVGGAQKL